MGLRTIALIAAALLVLGALVYLGAVVEPGASPGADVAREPATRTPPLQTPRTASPEPTASTPEQPQEPPESPIVLDDPEQRELAQILDRVAETDLLYDDSDYAGAVTKAKEVLELRPENARALRVLVPSACILGDADTAREYYRRIAVDSDRRHVAQVCDQHGVDL